MERPASSRAPHEALPALSPLDALALPLASAPVPTGQRVAGDPETGVAELARLRGARVGVWEMTEGAMNDVEADEVFVVLEGAAEVDLLGTGGEPRRIALRPGVVVRLAAGMTTRWTVSERLRKLYVAGEPDTGSRGERA